MKNYKKLFYHYFDNELEKSKLPDYDLFMSKLSKTSKAKNFFALSLKDLVFHSCCVVMVLVLITVSIHYEFPLTQHIKKSCDANNIEGLVQVNIKHINVFLNNLQKTFQKESQL